MNDMEDSDLIKQLNGMSLNDLESFLLTTRITSGFSSITGIGSILFTLMVTNIVTILITCVVLHIFGNIAVASNDLKAHIQGLIKTKFKDK